VSVNKRPSLLIVGGTKAGKSHFGGQLLRRLELKRGQLRLVGAAGDLTPFREVLDRLSQGKAASHTPSGTYKECVWSVDAENSSNHSELVWPDYAGEQLERIVNERHVPEQWVERIRQANGWLFFVRLSIMSAPSDIFDRPRDLGHMQGDANPQQPGAKTPASGASVDMQAQQNSSVSFNGTPTPVLQRTELSTQEKLVELLQALLYAGQISSNVPVLSPALTLVLSCYDEAASPVDGVWEDPAAVLRRKLPLLSQFVESNWQPGKLQVIGLSALGKSLSEDESDEEFLDNGPETQGWCICKGGARTTDLTYPVALIMESVKSS
jgi:hypothetical protein